MPDPTLSIRSDGASHLSIRRYTGTPPEMNQPALSDNLVCMHLGGPKEVRRWHDGHFSVQDVAFGSLTVMPAHQSNRWLTRGPIDFAHLMLSEELVGRVLVEELDLDPANYCLADVVGFRDAHLERLFNALLEAVEAVTPLQRLYPDSLLLVFLVMLLKQQPLLAARATAEQFKAKGGLASWRLQRVIDYMRAHLCDDVSLDELSALSGLSRAQFFRAFKQSTYASPHRFLTNLRLEAALPLLIDGEMDLITIAATVGLPQSEWFSTLFRQRFGIGPIAYRRNARS